jgi:hypothetical protein
MKKKFSLVAIALAAVFSSFAQEAESKYAMSEVALASFDKVVIDANVDVVLVQNDTLRRAFIEGDDQLVPQVAVTVKNGTLNVHTSSRDSYKGKVQVTIAVQKLSSLEINGDAGVTSMNHIVSPKLTVAVNSDCNVHLKTTGKIVFDTAEGFNINYVYNSAANARLQKREG